MLQPTLPLSRVHAVVEKVTAAEKYSTKNTGRDPSQYCSGDKKTYLFSSHLMFGTIWSLQFREKRSLDHLKTDTPWTTHTLAWANVYCVQYNSVIFFFLQGVCDRQQQPRPFGDRHALDSTHSCLGERALPTVQSQILFHTRYLR